MSAVTPDVPRFITRRANPADACAIAKIYKEGIADRPSVTLCFCVWILLVLSAGAIGKRPPKATAGPVS
jgi:hypothetical protein